MKNFYNYLKGTLAALLFCVPLLVSADATADEILANVAGKYEMSSSYSIYGSGWVSAGISTLTDREITMSVKDGNIVMTGFLDETTEWSLTPTSDGTGYTLSLPDGTSSVTDNGNTFSLPSDNAAWTATMDEETQMVTFNASTTKGNFYNGYTEYSYFSLYYETGKRDIYIFNLTLTQTSHDETTTEATLGETLSSYEDAELTKTYALYNHKFNIYATYSPDKSTANVWAATDATGVQNPDGNHACNVSVDEFDATDANMAWMLVEKDGKKYLYNVGAKKYVLGPENTGFGCFTDDANALTSIVEHDDATGCFAFETDANLSSTNYFCAAMGNTTGPIQYWNSDDVGSHWQLIENPNVEADADIVAEYTPTVSDDPSELAGKYEATFGSYTCESIDGSDYLYEPENVSLTYNVKITVNEKGEACMTGLVGTPATGYHDLETDEWVKKDSCYVGVYDATAKTITFTFPEGYDITDDYYEPWAMNKPFTLNVSKGTDGYYTLSTDDVVTYVFGGEVTYVHFNGLTMKQQPKYNIAREDMPGKWKLTYTTNDENGDEVEGGTTTFTIYEDEEGNLKATDIFGSTQELNVTYTEWDGISIDYFRDYNTGEYISGDTYSFTNISFAFGPDETMALETKIFAVNDVTGYDGAIALAGSTATKLPKIEQLVEEGANYLLYNSTYTSYAIFDPSRSTENVWTSGTIGDDSHPLEANVSEVDTLCAGHLWQLQIGENGEYYLYNIDAQKYLNTGYPCTFSSEKVALEVVELADDQFAFKTASDEDNTHFACVDPRGYVRYTENACPMAAWTSDDAGSAWKFIKVNSTELSSAYEVTAVSPETNTEDALLDEMVSGTVTFTTNAASLSDATVYYKNDDELEPVQLDAANISIEGGVVTVTLPEDVTSGQSYLSLALEVNDPAGYPINYTAEYYATASAANTFTMVSADPADDTEVDALNTITVTMSGTVGYVDESKTIVVTDNEGKQITTATIAYGENWTDAVITLVEDITEPGDYKVVVPEGTIWNDQYDESMDDLGVSMGATYNPEFVLTYTVKAESNSFDYVSFEPADKSNDLETLESITVTMDGTIGGFGEDKVIVVTDETGADTITTATINWTDPDDVACTSAVITFADEITEAGTYRVVIPEGIIFNEMFGTDEAVCNRDTVLVYTIAGEPAPERFEFLSASPADGSTVAAPFSTVTITMNGAIDEDYIGGFDSKKVIKVTDAKGNLVTTATITKPGDESITTNNAILTFAEPITEDGTYTITIPAGTLYDKLYDSYLTDFGVSEGTLYNDEIVLTYTVSTTSGINDVTIDFTNKEVYTVDGIKLNVTKTSKLQKGVYIVDGKKVIIK